MQAEPIETIYLLPVMTVVLWVTAVAVGVAGLWLPDHATAPTSQPSPAMTQTLDVDLDQTPPPADVPPPSPAQPTLIAPAFSGPRAIPKMPVLAATPSPAISFMPAARPTRATDTSHAASRNALISAPLPPVRTLVYGRGEGRQPAPLYPPQAVADQQQGVVIVRFLVDPAGTVQTAQASSPCVWPLLNDAAVQAVRDTWHFPPGAARSYEVAIRFQLRQL